MTKVIHEEEEGQEEAEGGESGDEEEESGAALTGESENSGDESDEEGGGEDWSAARDAALAASRRDFGIILRSKGSVWLPGQPERSVSWSSAGVVLRLELSSPWFATLDEDEWPEDAEVRRHIRADFDPDAAIGDRRQEIVFIGQSLRPEAIRAALDACLCEELPESGVVVLCPIFCGGDGDESDSGSD
jgi:G3E family GTPase